MVIALVLVAIVVAATIYFVLPLRQSVDVATRAELTDTADNALQRIGRDVRLSLPNSVRTDGTRLEFIPVRSAGRYRASSSGAACDTGTDELAFDVTDTCFKSIGTVSNASTIGPPNADFLVLNNYGSGFAGQDAYATSGTLNRRLITTAANEGSRERIVYSPNTALDRTLHDSPGKRFFIVGGNTTTGLPEPVTYECNAAPSGGTLTRRWGYTMLASQPTTPAQFAAGAGTSAVIANDVTGCSFNYDQNGIAPQVGLLTLQLTLGLTVSGGQSETVTLYHSIHVNNVP